MLVAVDDHGSDTTAMKGIASIESDSCLSGVACLESHSSGLDSTAISGLLLSRVAQLIAAIDAG